MKYFLSVILLGVISDNVTAQLSARDITCQVQHVCIHQHPVEFIHDLTNSS
jgi:hypothetical protein